MCPLIEMIIIRMAGVKYNLRIDIVVTSSVVGLLQNQEQNKRDAVCDLDTRVATGETNVH